MSHLHSIAAGSAGLYDLAFAGFHIAFWQLFHWPDSLAPSGRLNSAVTQTLNVMLSYVFIVAGIALIALAALDRDAVFLAAAGAGFWALRALLQPILFGMQSRLSPTMFVIFVFGATLHGLAAGVGLLGA
ncbi:MAG TPA: hypothetical protein VK629_09790 [Steroidobacteraceae bacterium]|nr:hypothetical protein [Steroidobacteraceae bacterium]